MRVPLSSGRARTGLSLFLLAAVFGCRQPGTTTSTARPSTSALPQTGAAQAAAGAGPGNPNARDDGQWTTAAKDPANTRYSALSEITLENVGRLKVAWTFSTGVAAGHEVAPLLVGTTT